MVCLCMGTENYYLIIGKLLPDFLILVFVLFILEVLGRIIFKKSLLDILLPFDDTETNEIKSKGENE